MPGTVIAAGTEDADTGSTIVVGGITAATTEVGVEDTGTVGGIVLEGAEDIGAEVIAISDGVLALDRYRVV
jgi:alpha-D-ribose 1-methylphosphonate 5-triphosphate synthase subunit PhnG